MQLTIGQVYILYASKNKDFLLSAQFNFNADNLFVHCKSLTRKVQLNSIIFPEDKKIIMKTMIAAFEDKIYFKPIGRKIIFRTKLISD